MSSTPTPPPPPPSGSGRSPAGGSSSDSRTWGMLAHLSAFVAAFVALAFLGPLLVWLVKRDEDRFVGEHAREALNFNLSLLLYGVVGTILLIIIGIVTLGVGFIILLPFAGVIGIVWVVLVIIAAMKAYNGEPYRYPLTIRFV